MRHIQPIIRCAGGGPTHRSIPRLAWIRLAIGAAAFATAALAATQLLS